MPKTFRLSRQALLDINEIWDNLYDSSSSFDVADKVVADIFEGFDFLAENPEAGHVREELADKTVKFWSVHKFLVVYRPTCSPLEVIAIIHAARDVSNLLADR